MKELVITTEYIELQNVLKIQGYISTGGEAKIYLQSIDVYVNNEKETRRGRKLYPGDVVVIENDKTIIKK